jgi:hypothetical protein
VPVFPVFNDLQRIVQAYEPILIQAFASELSVEAFNEGILNRLAWFDEVQRHAVRVCRRSRPQVSKFEGEHYGRQRTGSVSFSQKHQHSRQKQKTRRNVLVCLAGGSQDWSS